MTDGTHARHRDLGYSITAQVRDKGVMPID
jgi:hypothetical protein